MADFINSLVEAVGGRKKPVDDPNLLVVDHPESGFVAVPRDMAQKSGWDIPPGILPSQIPQADRERSRMAAIYRINKAARQRGEKIVYGKSPEVVIDDPREGLISVPYDVAARSGYAQILRIKPGDIPSDKEARRAATAKIREDKRAREIADEVGAEKLQEANADADRQFAALNAPPPAARPAPAAAKPRSQVASEPPTPAIPPTAPSLPPMLAPAADPDAEAKAWTRDFVPQATGFAPGEGAALLALAKGSGRPSGAPMRSAAPDAEGVAVRQMAMPPAMSQGVRPASAAPMPSGEVAQGAGNEADLMAQLRDAQRSDGYSSGFRALGDQFRDAMNLILNVQGPRSNMAAGDGGYVAAVQQQRALAEAQAKARRDERLTDATVASKERDATKDAAALEAAKAKAEKTAQDAATAASLNDPSSPESERIRELAIQLLGQRVDASTLAKLSGAEIKDIALKNGVSLTNAEQSNGLRALGLQQTGADTDYANSLRAQGLEIQRQELELAKARLAQQQSQFDDSLKDKDAARADARADKAQVHNEKMAQLNVGGFSFDPANPPSTDAAKKMADVKIARDLAFTAINNLRGLVQKHGTETLGSVAGKMETEWKVATDELRKIGEMGVPNGSDYAMLAMQLPNPTQGSDYMRSRDRNLANYATALDQLDRNVATSARAYKYTETPRSAPTSKPPNLDLSTDVKEPSLPGVTPPPQSTAPAAGVRVVSTKDLEPGALKKLVKEGETIRTKETKRLMRKTNGKLIYVKE